MSTPPKNKGRSIVKINAFTKAKLIEAMLDGVYRPSHRRGGFFAASLGMTC